MFNHFLRVPKHEVMNTKKLQVITRQGTRIREDKEKSVSTIMKKHDYPNPTKQKKLFKDATQVFKDLIMQEDNRKKSKC